MSDLITYDDKIRLKSQNVSEKYKVTAGDMNEIKSVVNTNVELVDEINKPENWVSVGTTAPTDGRRVFFANSKNVLQHNAYNRTLNGITLKVNDDKSITLTGTASANTNFNIGTSSTLTLKAGTYTFTKGATNVQLLIYYSSASVLGNLPIGTSSQTITINKDTTYENYRVVITIPNGTQINEIVYPMLRLSTTSNTYEPYIEKSINVDDESFILTSDLVSVGANQPSDGKRVWFKKTNNIANPQNVNLGKTLGTTGALLTSGTRTTIYQIPIKPNTQYAFSVASNYQVGNFFYYKADKTYLSQVGGNWENSKIATTPSNAYYISFATRTTSDATMTTSDLDNLHIQIEEGSSATNYVPFEKGIYANNEQWYNTNINEYSTTEQVIGKWLNGETLYRKVIDFGAMPNATSKDVAHGITNLSRIITYNAIMSNGSTNFPIPIAQPSNTSLTAYAYVTNTNVHMETTTNRSSYTAFVILEYTKTTD